MGFSAALDGMVILFWRLVLSGVFAAFVVNRKHNQTNSAAKHKEQNQTADVSMGVTAKQNREKGKAGEYQQTATAALRESCTSTRSSRWWGWRRLRRWLGWLGAVTSPRTLPTSIELVFDALVAFWASPHMQLNTA